jgi:cell division protein FtsW
VVPIGSKAKAAGYDMRLLFPVLFLVCIGVVMVYSASSAISLKTHGSSYLFLKKQAVFAVVGMALLLMFRRLPYQFLRPLAYPLLVVAVFLLAAVQLPGFGVAAGGSTRWLRAGEFTFQPSEFARLALMIYLAYSLEKKRDRLKSFAIGFVPHVLVLALLMALILLQPDFGSAAILAAATWIVLFAGGVRLVHLLGSLILLLPAVGILMIQAEYRLKRLLSFLDPWQYPAAEGYQIIHSMMAFGTGGIWGTGIGKGYQKLFYLPEPHTDFIFSVIGEELGLVGVTVILALYTIILWRGITIARNTEDMFGSLLALGLTVGICLQVCVNMGVALGLLPTKGLTLPFLSYGGTSLLVNMASIGILMNISATARTGGHRRQVIEPRR